MKGKRGRRDVNPDKSEKIHERQLPGPSLRRTPVRTVKNNDNDSEKPESLYNALG